MKTTIDIADDLLARAKEAAREQDTTLKELTEQGLRLVLDQREQQASQAPIEPFIVTGRAPAPDLSWDHLREVLYGQEER